MRLQNSFMSSGWINSAKPLILNHSTTHGTSLNPWAFEPVRTMVRTTHIPSLSWSLTWDRGGSTQPNVLQPALQWNPTYPNLRPLLYLCSDYLARQLCILINAHTAMEPSWLLEVSSDCTKMPDLNCSNSEQAKIQLLALTIDYMTGMYTTDTICMRSHKSGSFTYKLYLAAVWSRFSWISKSLLYLLSFKHNE